jgi:rhomboid protease GluP
MTPQKTVLDKILEALGFNPTRLRWRLHRLRERSRSAAQEVENRTRPLTYANKVCPSCGLPAAVDEKRCPRCGQRLHSLAVQQALRLFRLVFPEGEYTYTAFFAIVCAAFFLAMMMRSGGTAALVNGIALPVIIRFGAWTVPHIAAGQVWRLVTPIFLHFGLLHIIFNGLWLLQLGPLVERAYGRSRYLFIWLATGVGGFAASVLYRWQAWQQVPAPGGGASGVVFGLIGIALAATVRRRGGAAGDLRGSLVKGLIYGLVFSLLPGIDLMAHLGGGVTGFVLGLVLADRQQARRAPDRLWLVIELLCLAIIVGSFVLVIIRP